jgi:hypothetical protein
VESEQNPQEERPEEPQQGSSQGEGERLPEPNKVDATPGEAGRPERLPDSNTVEKGQDPEIEERGA